MQLGLCVYVCACATRQQARARVCVYVCILSACILSREKVFEKTVLAVALMLIILQGQALEMYFC